MRLAALFAIACIGCIDSHDPTCGNLTCPSGTVCSTDQTCVAPAQITACSGLVEGARCSFGEVSGICHDTTCVISLGLCGDGVAELALDELCDCGTADHLAQPPVGCSGFNSNDPGATCRPDCRPARCGDAILDPDEQCDDGNTISGDGCRADCQGRFAKMETPTAENLATVLALSPTDVYAAGDGGTVLHYDGLAWSNVELGTTANFAGSYALSSTDLYLAGAQTDTTSELWHFDGVTWSMIDTMDGDQIADVWASSPTDVYVTTYFAAYQNVVHFTGASWDPVTICTGNGTTSISGTGASNVYIGTIAGLCRYDGSSWSRLDLVRVQDLVQSSPTEILELGQDPDTGIQTITRWTGASATTVVQVPGVVSTLMSTSPAEILAVGGDGVVLRYDGTNWTNLVSPTELQLRGIAATDPSDVFVVGNSGTVLH